MMDASTPRQAQVRIIAPAFCAISGSNRASRSGADGSAIMRSHDLQEAKNQSAALRAENVAIACRAGSDSDAPAYGHPNRSVRKTASNVDLRRGAAIDDNAGNVPVAMRGPLPDRQPEIA